MKKGIPIAILLIAAIAVAGLLLKAIYEESPNRAAPYRPGPQPQFEELSFELHYMGLPCGKDQLRYNSYWGFGGGSGEDSEFIKAVTDAVEGNIEVVYNSYFKDAEYSAVEYKGRTPLKFYFDLNADGKLSDNEIIAARKEPNGQTDTYEFITPDFTMKTQDGKERPFRALLQARFYSDHDRLNTMWSPACVFEGTAKIDGMDAKVILLSNGFTGRFDEYGRSHYAMLFDNIEPPQYLGRSTLSKIITHADAFYDVTVDVNDAVPTRITFSRSTAPTGGLDLKLAGDTGVKVRLNNANLRGAEDPGIYFVARADTKDLPAGDYEMTGGYIMYGPDDQYAFNTSFTRGPDLTIEPNETCTVELGDPKIKVVAVDEKQRYAAEPEEKTVYKKGATVFLSPRVVGKAGEVYGAFRTVKDNRSVDLTPTVTITDPDGKQITSKAMEYG